MRMRSTSQLSVGVNSKTLIAALRLPSTFSKLNGIAAAGGGFSHDAANLPGTNNVQYQYPTSRLLTYLRSRGHRVVRIDFRWERIQHELMGPLDPTGFGELRDCVQRCADAGLLVLLDMHNYGRFIGLDDVELIFGIDGTLSQAHFNDVWTKLVNAFAGQPAIAGWGIMNEPHDFADIPATPGTFSGTDIATFDSTIEGWEGGTGSTLTVGSFPGMKGTGALTVSKVLAANSGNFNASTTFQSSGPAANFPAGSMLRFQVYVPNSTPGTRFQMRGGIVSTSYSIIYGPMTSVTKGQIVNVDVPVLAAQSGTNHLHVYIEFYVDGSDGVTPSVVQIGNYAVGTISGATPPQKVWPLYSQSVVNAIRATGDVRPIYVPGYNFSGVNAWTTHNPATAWITDPANNIVYEAHYYFDANTTGFYNDDYATTVSKATGAGYANMQARVAADIKVFTDWLSANTVKGFIGEMGWPKGADAASWNAIGDYAYSLLDAAGVGVSYWASGDFWGNSYMMEPYNVPDLTLHPQAAIIEAHPSRYKNISDIPFDNGVTFDNNTFMR